MPATERILVFIPMYQCERQIPRVLGRFTESIQKHFAHVLVVDNGSRDGSVAAATEALTNLKFLSGSVVVNQENYNLGGSHKVAFQYALDHGFDYVVVLHGDDQADIADLIPQLNRGIHRQYVALLGSRFMKGSQLIGYSRFRSAGNQIFNALFSLAARRRVQDLGSGLNMYAASFLRERFFYGFPNSLTFNIYLLLAGIHRRANFLFSPLTWREEDQRSNVKMVQQAAQTFRMAFDYWRDPSGFLDRDVSGRPGKPYEFRVAATTNQVHAQSVD